MPNIKSMPLSELQNLICEAESLSSRLHEGPRSSGGYDEPTKEDAACIIDQLVEVLKTKEWHIYGWDEKLQPLDSQEPHYLERQVNWWKEWQYVKTIQKKITDAQYDEAIKIADDIIGQLERRIAFLKNN